MSECEGDRWLYFLTLFLPSPPSYHILSPSLTSNPLFLAAAQAAKKLAKEKKKGKKQAGAPKKPMSAFFCYQGARRENLKQEAPNLDHKDIIKVSPEPLLSAPETFSTLLTPPVENEWGVEADERCSEAAIPAGIRQRQRGVQEINGWLQG